FDDFEDPEWSYDYQLPKSSYEQDDRQRAPIGRSSNMMWLESRKRGTPDHVKRIETPPNGIPGSEGALLIRTLNSGVPGTLSPEPMQDDLILNMAGKFGSLDVSRGANAVVRVWMPPFEEWDQRGGSHFGVRIACRTTKEEMKGAFIFRRRVREPEAYWPGMFIQYMPKSAGFPENSAALIIRGADNGGDFRGPSISGGGWWTLGMSVTPDGKVHYYAREGVEDLRAQDRLASTTPYGYDAELFSTMFFNITSRDDGKTWSTPFVIDDPAVYAAY
ncbi:MAG: hypothetical protein AAGJ97_14385, partial [Planctomycetota bacterium]